LLVSSWSAWASAAKAAGSGPVAWLGKSAWTAASNALVEAESGGKEFAAEQPATDHQLLRWAVQGNGCKAE